MVTTCYDMLQPIFPKFPNVITMHLQPFYILHYFETYMGAIQLLGTSNLGTPTKDHISR